MFCPIRRGFAVYGAILLLGLLHGRELSAQQPSPGLKHALRAQQLMQNRNNEAAIGEWEAALRREPANATYRNLYGLALEAVGQKEQAQRQFREAVRLNPRLAAAYSNLGYSLWSEGEELAAAGQFDSALRVRPSDPALHMARGLLETSTGRAHAACEHFDKAHPWPDDPETLWIVFGAYLASEQLEKALQAARRLPDRFDLQLAIGRALRGFRQGLAAIPFLENARSQKPQLPEVVFELANTYGEAGKPERALAAIAELPAEVQGSFEVLELRGSALLKLGRRSEAQTQFQRLLEIYPDNPESYVHATQVPLEDENWAETLAMLDAGLEKLPNHWLLLFRRAMTHRLMGSLTKAHDDLMAAAQHGGDAGLVAAALGELYSRLGDLAKTADIFREAYRRTNQPAFQYALALSLQRMGKDADALPEFERAVDLFPKNARIRYEYGKSLQRLGRVREAREQLERSKAIDPNLADTWYALARLYRSLGQTNMARQAAQEFLTARKKQSAGQAIAP